MTIVEDLTFPKSAAPVNQSLRIAFCLPVLRPPDTTDTSILLQYLIAGELKKRGHQLTYIAPANLQDVVCTPDMGQPTPAPQSWSRSGWYRFARKVSWRLQQWLHIPYLNVYSNYNLMDACLQCLPGHDIVQERIGLYKSGVAMACRRLGLPYILFWDADDIFEQDLLGTPLTGLLRWRAAQVIRYNLHSAAYVLCVSEAARARLEGVWQVPGDRIGVFSNAVDVELHRPYPQERAAARAGVGVDEQPLVVFVGSFFPWQDVSLLLRAFAKVRAEVKDARLVLVGDGQQAQEMKNLAGELGLAEVVHFSGFLPHPAVARLVSAADVAVAPYAQMDPAHFFGSSMKLFEYMACGAPLVASAIGQIEQIVVDGQNGLLVPPGDLGALANALRRLLQDPKLRAHLGQAARRDAVHKHSWDNYIRRLEDVYTTVLSRQTANQVGSR